MAIIERKESRIEIHNDFRIQEIVTTILERDGVEISRLHHRGEFLYPGQDVSAKDEKIKKAASTFWDAATVAEYHAEKEKRLNNANR